MDFLLGFREAVILLGVLLATYTDLKSGLILDKITYPMIAIGILLNAYEFFFSWDWTLFAVGGIVFALGYALYYLGKIGGGDVKLFAGIALLLPFLQGQVFLLVALFIAAIVAVVFLSTLYVVKYAEAGIKLGENRRGIMSAVLVGAVVALYFIAVVQMRLMRAEAALLLCVPIAFALLFLAFEYGIRKNFFLKKVPLEKLEEDEVIAFEFFDEALKQKLNLKVKGVLGKKEIERIREAGISEVPVYRGLPPFAPFILVGCIIAMWQPALIVALFL